MDVTQRKARQAAREQARQDMHNAARKMLTDEGLSVAEIRKDVSGMVEKAIKAVTNDMVANGRLQKVVEEIVKEEISRQFMLKDAFKNAFEAAVRRQFNAYADTFIKDNLVIRILDGGPGAGSFS